MTEASLLRSIRKALNLARDAEGHLRCRVVRNTVGFDQTRKVRYGLGTGSADLVGLLRGGRVLAIEVKTPGALPTAEQRAWIAAVRRWGGAAACVRSVDEAMAALTAAESGG